MIPKNIKIGNNFEVQDNVILGCKPERHIQSLETIIGNNARIRHGTVIYLGSKIGNNLNTGHGAVIREQNEIGDDFNIWNNSTVDYGCIIGNNIKIHCNCYVSQFTTIEDDVFIAPGVIMANDVHPGCELSKKCMRGPIIKKGAQIGCNATILPFLTIGERAIVGAGSVVTKDVPPETVVYGNPARPMGSIYDLKCITKLTDKPYRVEI